MAAIKRITKETEASLMRLLEKVSALVDNGDTPDDAIVKTANEHEVPPGHIRLMVHAYNTGRTNIQRRRGSDIFEKSAHFTLADADKIIGRLYPDTDKVAEDLRSTEISDEYSTAPLWLGERERREKVAMVVPPLVESPPAPLPRDPDRFIKRAWGLVDECNRVLEEKRRLVSESRDKVAAHLESLDEYFRRSGSRAFSDVANAAAMLFGGAATKILEKVAAFNPTLEFNKTAGLCSQAHPTWEPFRTIQSCLDECRRWGSRKADYEQFEKEAREKLSELSLTLIPSDAMQFAISALEPLEKKAIPVINFLNDAARTALSAETTRRMMESMPGHKSKDEVDRESFEGLTDPIHVQRLNNMRTQYMLHRLLAEDEQLRTHDPAKITDLFNQISQLSPRAASQPLYMQAMIRRQLAGGEQLDTHELGSAAEFETKLKQRDQPMERPELPATILGTGKKKDEKSPTGVAK